MNTEWIRLLHKAFIFSTFNESQLGQVVKRMKLTSLPKGATLFDKNEVGKSFFLIVSGSIRILLDSPKDDKSAKNNTFVYLDRGDILGEMALLAGEPYANTAVVDSTAELLVLGKQDFDEILEKNPTIAVHLSRVLSSRLATVHRTAGGGVTQPSQRS